MFLYTNNELSEKEFGKTIPFTIIPKGVKCLGTNLTKEVNDCILMRSINEGHLAGSAGFKLKVGIEVTKNK